MPLKFYFSFMNKNNMLSEYDCRQTFNITGQACKQMLRIATDENKKRIMKTSGGKFFDGRFYVTT